MKKIFGLLFIAPVALIAQTNFKETAITNTIKVVKVNDQISLGYSTQSGVKIIYKDGLPFKDLNKNGQLDKYEESKTRHGQQVLFQFLPMIDTPQYPDRNNVIIQSQETVCTGTANKTA